MITIFRREFKSYLTNMIGYVVIAALCLLTGLFFCLYNVRMGHPYFAYALSSVQSYMMILIPILTMRCFSDERKSKTDQLLLTSPASIWEIVIGKFLGMAAIFAIPFIISCVYPFILSSKESHSFIIDYSAILAFVLLGFAYISIGMFISTLTESQIIAAVITFIVFFAFFLMPNLVGFIPEASYANAVGFSIIAFVFAIILKSVTKNVYAACMTFLILVTVVWGIYLMNRDIYVGLLAKVLTIISFSDGIVYFSAGIFDLSQIVMSLSVMVLFCFLTVQSIQKRRWN